jgi:hypothetical protein
MDRQEHAVLAVLLLIALVGVCGLLAVAQRHRDTVDDLWDLTGWHDQLDHDPSYEGRHRQ